MNFSIILNSRNRIDLLSNLLWSIKTKTKDLSNIEVLINIDDDDKSTLDFANFNQYLFDFTKFFISSRQKNLHIRINTAAFQAKGRWIFILNDDTEIITQNWDEISYNILSKGYDIIYGRTNCTSMDKEKGGEYSSFPIISKEAVNKLGYFMSEQLVGLGADVHIWRVYNTINRIVDIPIQIRHILHETLEQVVNPDQTSAEMRTNTYSDNINPWTIDISKDIKKLI